MTASVFIIVIFLAGGVYAGILYPLPAVMAGALVICSSRLIAQAPELPRERATAVGCLATIIAVVGLALIFVAASY